MSETRQQLSWLLEQTAAALAYSGGSAARAEAITNSLSEAHRLHPWNGRGLEPLDHLSTRLAVLVDQLNDLLEQRPERTHDGDLGSIVAFCPPVPVDDGSVRLSV